MKNVPYAITKFCCWSFFGLRFGLEVTGQAHVPRRGPVIVASNHVSFLDPPILGAACPRWLRFMARDTLFAHGWLALFMRSVRVIPLRRGEADLGAIREALEALREGEAVAIFPEGGRQRSGRLGTAKRGIGVLADLSQATVVPAFITGSYRALPPDATRLQPSKIRVAFGPPIPYTGVPLPAGLPERRAALRARREQLADAVTQAWGRLAAQQERGSTIA